VSIESSGSRRYSGKLFQVVGPATANEVDNFAGGTTSWLLCDDRSRYRRCFILMKNRVRPDSQLFNIWVVTAGGRGRPIPSRLEGMGERCKLPQQGPGQSPSRKTSFGVFRAWKNTPDFTSPDFFHFLRPLFPGFPGEWSRWMMHWTIGLMGNIGLSGNGPTD